MDRFVFGFGMLKTELKGNRGEMVNKRPPNKPNHNK